MEILTLLKANIKKKKGVFISIAVLMFIITTVASAIFSVRDNYEKGIKAALESADCGDTTVMLKSEALTDELLHSVENSSLVAHVDCYDALCSTGIECGDMSDSNSVFMTLMRDGIKLYNSSLSGFEDNVPELSTGEIYLPLGLKEKIGCSVGDKVTLNMTSGIDALDFTLKGFVEEPVQGSMTIGWKQIFISPEDYDRIYDICKPMTDGERTIEMKLLSVHQSEETALSPVKFQRELNLETKLIDKALGALNKEQSIRYSTLMPDIIMDIVMVFIIFLFVIVLIVMSHSIGTEIETDYVALGILKSQGFESLKLRLIFFLQYMMSLLLGITAGVFAALPIEDFISSDFQLTTGILPASSFSLVKIFIFAFFMLLCSTLIIIVKTHKLTKISPIRAISCGREEVYFDSRLNAPISKRTLLTSLAFRQFTSSKKRYISTIAIVSILSFFMITVNLIGAMLSSRSALSSMGLMTCDIEISYSEVPDKDYIDEAEKFIEQQTKVTEKNRQSHFYCSINGENLSCEIYKYPEYMPGLLKGREPKYENEILITEMVGETLDLNIGDKAIISYGDKDSEFLISGIYQSAQDSGMTFSMNFDGAEALGINTKYAYASFVLEDKNAVNGLAEKLIEKYGDILNIYVYDETNNPVMGQFYDIVNMIKVIIYSFSIFFAFVVVRMICVKTFISERKDVGIFRALGFTASKLRLSFAIRFVITALLGTSIGILLSVLFSEKLLSVLLSLIGLSSVMLDFTVMSVVVPILVLCFSFFVFSYFASKGIKGVEIRELVSE